MVQPMQQRPPSPTPRAGGLPIALGALAGSLIGATFGRPVHGAIGGLLLGVGVAVAIWLVDRRRG